jgi:hypothetical protein
VDVWNHQPIGTEKKNGRIRLVSPEEPADAMSCIVGMPKSLNVETDGGTIRIEAERPLPNTELHINTVDNLTMMEEEGLKIPGSRATVDASQLKLDFPYLVLVKLMQDGVLKDEVIANVGWKQF